MPGTEIQSLILYSVLTVPLVRFILQYLVSFLDTVGEVYLFSYSILSVFLQQFICFLAEVYLFPAANYLFPAANYLFFLQKFICLPAAVYLFSCRSLSVSCSKLSVSCSILSVFPTAFYLFILQKHIHT